MSSPPTAKRREKRATQTKNIVDEFNLLDQHVLQFEDNNQRKRKASLVSSKHSLLKYTTYEHVRQHVDFFFRIKDAALNREFYEFSSMKKSGGFLMLMSMMISFLMFPMHVMIFCEDLKETDNQNYTYRCVTSFLSLLGTILCSVTGWILYFHHASDSLLPYVPGRWIKYLFPHLLDTHTSTSSTSHGVNGSGINSGGVSPSSARSNRSITDRHPSSMSFNNASQNTANSVHNNSSNNSNLATGDESNSKLLFDDKSWNPLLWTIAKRREAIYYINMLFVGSAQLFFITIFFRRSLGLNCSATANFMVRLYSGSRCFYGDDLIHVLLYNAMMMLTIPILFFINLPDTPIVFVWMLFILSIVLFVLLAVFMGHSDVVPSLSFWIFVCYFTIVDVQGRNVLIFFANRELSETLNENERMAEQIHANEMRSMIANVAHDLKTPLSSFITGIDYIQHVITDFKKATDTLGQSISARYRAHISELISNIEVCSANIRNTNTFMLMTINRCIDYTKASKGLQLVPRFETIDLRETLELPLQCMQNIQQRIEIKLNAFPLELCSHIITDKQWLQENVLCLLSNAVKYSTEGNVTISLTLERDTQTGDRVRRQVLKIEHAENGSARIVPIDQPSNMTLMTMEEGTRNVETELKPNNAISVKESFTENDLLLRIEIEDTGIGMTEEAMSTLFNPFKQTQRLAGGTGLGLYSLAKRVEALQGNYGVMKRRDGVEGSLFWFSIPYRPDPMIAQLQDGTLNINTPKARLLVNSVMRRQDSDVAALTKSSESKSNSRTDLLHANPLSPRTGFDILIVDDSVAIVKMTTLMLKKLGHRISTAENGEVAVKMIQEKWNSSKKRFDVVLMDLQMPVMDGLEATRRIRRFEELQKKQEKKVIEQQELKVSDVEDLVQNRATDHRELSSSIPKSRQVIIGMSANSDHETAATAIAAGVDTFIAKPFNLITFTETVDSLLPADVKY